MMAANSGANFVLKKNPGPGREGSAALHHRGQRGRRQVDADRPAALRFPRGLRGPARLGRARPAANRSTGPWISRCSPTACGPSASRASPSTWRTATFATPRRKFIIADTPGHEQYTRNMATGASTARLAIILIDARKGVLPQSRRHAYIASLLGIRTVVVAVNKMDLVDSGAGRIRAHPRRIRCIRGEAGHPEQCYFIPMSALRGRQRGRAAARSMPWYRAPACSNTWKPSEARNAAGSGRPFRLPVQYVIRPHLDFRGYAGQIASGSLRVGDRVLALPSGRKRAVERSIRRSPESLPHCLRCAGRQIDISRGDMLVAPAAPPAVAPRVRRHPDVDGRRAAASGEPPTC